MPPKTIRVKTPVVDAHQGSIQILFKKSATATATTAGAAAPAPAPTAAATHPVVPTTESDPLVSEFYASLGPKERIAHTIAVDKLGTSYDVKRTHGFLKWLKNRGS
jgi:hypothetical protein